MQPTLQHAARRRAQCGLPGGSDEESRCFQLLGFDVLLDARRLTPRPSPRIPHPSPFTPHSPLDLTLPPLALRGGRLQLHLLEVNNTPSLSLDTCEALEPPAKQPRTAKVGTTKAATAVATSATSAAAAAAAATSASATAAASTASCAASGAEAAVKPCLCMSMAGPHLHRRCRVDEAAKTLAVGGALRPHPHLHPHPHPSPRPHPHPHPHPHQPPHPHPSSTPTPTPTPTPT